MKDEKNTFLYKLSKFIVEKRNIIFILYVAFFAFSLFSQNWVKVCNDITAYLPADTETRRAIDIMKDEFTTYSTSKIMVINIPCEDAEELSQDIKELSCVKMLDFDDTEDYYKEGNALFNVTLNSTSGSDETKEGYEELREALSGYDAYFLESDIDDSKELEGEMNIVLAVAVFIILSVLLFTSKTYMEVPALLITFIAAAMLNKGTNFLFGEISYISNSVTAILQLALSIDYAIIMIHHYSEERELHNQHDAVISALKKSFVEISASSLTTISGLMALMFMQFRIGFDMGICLIKSIFFSLFCVFTLMPCLLMVLGKYIDKTHHKSFVPNISGLGSIVYKLRMVIPPIFVGAIILGYIFSSQCPFVYDQGSAITISKNESQISKEMINEIFGTDNTAAIIIPSGDYEKEKKLAEELKAFDEVKEVKGLSSVEAKDGYVLTDKLTPRQFSEMLDVDIDAVKLLYSMYATKNEDYSKLLGKIDSFSVPLLDMFTYVYDLKNEDYFTLDDDTKEKLDDLYIKLDSAKKQLQGGNYSRMLVNLDLPTEGEETFAFIDKMHEVISKYYDEAYIAGTSTSSYDLKKSFSNDNIAISILSILFVIIVLFFTFKSAGLPVLLIAVIQGSIWINFSIPYFANYSIFFMSYLIVSSIQMGANIDYAIVISNRYLEKKKTMPIKDAMKDAINFAFPTVLTSGIMLSSAGLLIGMLSTNPSIVSIGLTVCIGTAISMFLVMCVLPEILLLGDTIIEKTRFNLPTPEVTKKEKGNYIVNGRVRGYINGFVDADIHGLVRGEINATVNVNNIKETGDEIDEEQKEEAK